MENIEIKDLIKDGSVLSVRIKALVNSSDTRVSIDSNGINIIDEHLIWLNKVNKYFSDYFRNEKIKPYGLINKIKKIFAPSPLEEIYSIIDSEDLYSYFDDIDNKITDGIKILEEFSTKYSIKDNKNTKTILLISKKDLTISRKDSGFTCSFQKREGSNQRFKRLIKIIESKNISANDLIEYIGSGTKQNLSGENKKVNRFLKIKLGLMDDVITNDGNTGYKINERYEIEFIK
ncbi:MAG: hypothetical protein PHS54_03405 [Clostridia bacterium]|nr:hypothetical protein [Clostridia bacterium]